MSSLHFCQWDWCRSNFPSHALLASHVAEEHIEKAKPVRKAEIPLIRRVEEGVSGSSDGLPTMLGFTATQSEPASRSMDVDDDPHASAKTPSLPGLAKTPKRPSFSALSAMSSPASTPYVASQPATPALSALIAKAKRASPEVQSSRTHSTSSSREIEAELTQSVLSSRSASPGKAGSPLKNNMTEMAAPTEVPPNPPATQRAGPRSSAFMFRSGSLRIEPSSSQGPRSQKPSASSQMSDSQSLQPESQSQYQLQTQAPYLSQNT